MIEYKTLPGFDGYRVGSDGNVYSLWKPGGRRGSVMGSVWRRMKGCRAGRKGNDYRAVMIRRFGGVKRMIKIHHLVLEAFVGPRPDGMEACHNNGDRFDNRPSNLRWGTRSSNRIDSYNHKTKKSGERHQWGSVSDKTVVKLKKMVNQGMSYVAVERELGLTKDYVGKCMRGERRVRC